MGTFGSSSASRFLSKKTAAPAQKASHGRAKHVGCQRLLIDVCDVVAMGYDLCYEARAHGLISTKACTWKLHCAKLIEVYTFLHSSSSS